MPSPTSSCSTVFTSAVDSGTTAESSSRLSLAHGDADQDVSGWQRSNAMTAVVESMDLLHLILLFTADAPQDVAINVRVTTAITCVPSSSCCVVMPYALTEYSFTSVQLMGVCKQWEHMAKSLPVWQTMEWAHLARKCHRQPETPSILFDLLRRWWGSQLRSFAAQGCPVTCELLTDVFCSVLAEHAPHLQALCLCSCYRITDVGLLALAQAGPPLTHLELSWCGPAITAHGLLALAARMPGTQCVCAHMDRHRHAHTALESFVVSCGHEGNGLVSVDDAVISALVQHCPTLVTLGLVRITPWSVLPLKLFLLTTPQHMCVNSFNTE